MVCSSAAYYMLQLAMPCLVSQHFELAMSKFRVTKSKFPVTKSKFRASYVEISS